MSYIPNFEWTVGDMDRLNFMRKNPDMQFFAVREKLRGTQLDCTEDRLIQICQAFGLPLVVIT